MKTTRISNYAAALVLLGASLASCSTTADVLVNKEPGVFYGSAFGATEAAAAEKAYLDLIYTVLTETKGIRPAKKANFVLTAEIKDAFAAFKLKPLVSKNKDENRFDAVYRLSGERWEKAEAVRVERLSRTLGEAFGAIEANGAAPAPRKVKEAASLLATIERSGALGRIKGIGGSGAILNDQIEAYCRGITEGIVLAASPAAGLVGAGSAIEVSAADRSGKPLAALPLALAWKAGDSVSKPVGLVSGDNGKAIAVLPGDASLGNQKMVLAVSSSFASFQALPFLEKLDRSIAAEFSYRYSSAGSGLGKAVRIQGGTFAIGAVKRDKRAGSIEKPRTVTVATFFIDRDLVTNADYRAYLEAQNVPAGEYPDYWDNPDFNQPGQPVIGLSLKDAEKYAAWLSSVRSAKKRLPTEAEFEIAARGGKDVMFPWGDQLPSDGKRATYSGTSSFPTPVGSRENGRNAVGLNDMAGNVWEWTTTAPAGTMAGDPDYRIVKGGSYLDGQYELRISNRALRDPGERQLDVGFRLVSEAGDE
jgi:formylglycine-generating enzyme required for sulfatase activity